MNSEPDRPSRDDVQAGTVCDAIDKAVQALVDQGLAPTSIYLTAVDYERFAAEHTRIWRSKLGSTAFFWPLSHDDVPIISEHLADRLELPVRQASYGNGRGSAVYAAGGQSVSLTIAREL